MVRWSGAAVVSMRRKTVFFATEELISSAEINKLSTVAAFMLKYILKCSGGLDTGSIHDDFHGIDLLAILEKNVDRTIFHYIL